MSLNEEIELLEAGRLARDYAMRCKRLGEGRYDNVAKYCRERDIRFLQKFGKDLIKLADRGFNISRCSIDNRMISSYCGFDILASTESRWLMSEEGPYEECGQKLRDRGIDNLRKFGEFLVNVNVDELKKGSEALANYFQGYHDWANELMPNDDRDYQPIPVSDFALKELVLIEVE